MTINFLNRSIAASGIVRAGCITILCAILAGCASDTPASAQQSNDFDHAGDRPPSAQTLYAMAGMLASQGRDRDAQPILIRVIREHPDFIPAYCALAELQMRLRRVDDAISTLSGGLAASPGQPVLENDIGMCLLIKKQYADSLNHFTAAAALAPSNVRYRGNMAMALGMLGRSDEAKALYTQIMAPEDAEFNLNLLRLARGNDDHAVVPSSDKSSQAAPATDKAQPVGATITADKTFDEANS